MRNQDAKPKYKSVKRQEQISTISGYVTLVIMSIIWLYPVLWIILSAFRTERNDQGQLIGIVVSNYFPRAIGFDNFVNLFNNFHTFIIKFVYYNLIKLKS